MRDLIVKINTDHSASIGAAGADQQLTNNQFGLSDDPTGTSVSRPPREDDGSSTDGSDSGTAGTPTSQSFWPDLEVLDPDHPM